MLPSGIYGSAPMASSSKGTPGNAEEGRSNSKSNDPDSDIDEGVTLRPDHGQADSSDDEGNNASFFRGGAGAGSSSVVRPLMGFQFGQNQRPSGFGFGGNSAFSQFSSNQTNGFGAQSAPQGTSPGGLPAMGFALPTKIFRKNNNNAFGAFAGNSNTPSQVSPMGLSDSFMPVQPIDNTSTAVENGGPTFLAPNVATQSTSVVSGMESSRGETVHSPIHSASESQGQEGENPFANLISTGENVPANQVQDAAEASPAQTTHTHAAMEAASTLYTMSTSTSSSEPLSIDDIFKMFPPEFLTSANLDTIAYEPSSDLNSARDSNSKSPIKVPRKVGDDSCPPSSGVSSHGDDDDNASSYAPSSPQESQEEKQEYQTTQKKRRLKKDEERKRGAFRVRTYTSSIPQTERPFSTLPGKPFRLDNGTEETILPHFEYRESAKRGKRKPVPREPQEANPSSHSDSMANVNGSAGQLHVNGHEGLDVGHPNNEGAGESAIVDARRDVTQGDAAPPNQASTFSHTTGSSIFDGLLSNPPQPMGEASQYTGITGSEMQVTNEARLDPESAAVLAERSSTIENHLVTIMIEDKRYMNAEPSLVELVLPLCPSGKREYWLDAIVLGRNLQCGTSRIDGLAKAYVFRGRYRQYFLRVSAENKDAFGHGAVSVPYNRFLRVIVEPITPPMNQGAPGYSTQSMMPGPSTQVASNFHSASPAEQGLQMPVPVRATSFPQQQSSSSFSPALKRAREVSPPRTTSATASSSGAATPANGQGASTSNDMEPRKSYYRQRAL